jgi:hypothetical protein
LFGAGVGHEGEGSRGWHVDPLGKVKEILPAYEADAEFFVPCYLRLAVEPGMPEGMEVVERSTLPVLISVDVHVVRELRHDAHGDWIGPPIAGRRPRPAQLRPSVDGKRPFVEVNLTFRFREKSCPWPGLCDPFEKRQSA